MVQQARSQLVLLEHERFSLQPLPERSLGSKVTYIADHSAVQDGSFADFLERVLHTELDGRMQRTQEMLLKTSGMPAIKHFEDYNFKFATGAPRKQLQ